MQGSNSQTRRSWPKLKPRVRHSTNWVIQVPLTKGNFDRIWFLPWALTLEGNPYVKYYSIFYILKYKIKEKILPALFFLHLFIFERQRQSTSRGEAEREKETQNLKQAPDSQLSAQSPMQGLNSQNTRSWPEPKSDRSPCTIEESLRRNVARTGWLVVVSTSDWKSVV